MQTATAVLPPTDTGQPDDAPPPGSAWAPPGHGERHGTDAPAFDDAEGPADPYPKLPDFVQPALDYDTLQDFVAGFVAHFYARQIADQHTVVWCPQWWEHPEAIFRLGAMWQARHLCAALPLGPSVWWRDHVDTHMRHLLDPVGPFKYCSAKNGHKAMIEPLPIDECGPPPQLSFTIHPTSPAATAPRSPQPHRKSSCRD